MGHRYERLDINGIWDMGYGILVWVTRDIDMGYGLMIWEMTASIRSPPISIWDILSLCRSLRAGAVRRPEDGAGEHRPAGRGLHSSTFQLSLSRL